MQLPTEILPDTFDEEYRLRSEAWMPAVVETCVVAGIPAERIVPYSDGSNLVARVADAWVVKIFPPFHREQWESERCALPRIHAASPLPTPELVAGGERPDGYTFVVMTHLAGRSMEQAWRTLSMGERAGVMRSIGELMRAVHASPVGDLAAQLPDFDQMLSARVSGLRTRHERMGTPEWIADRLEGFVPSALAGLDLGTPPVLLTGEYTPFNLLLTEPGTPARLTAMFDFGDCMVGPAVYDLLGPISFLGEGRAELLQPLFEGRGLLDWPPSPDVRMGFLALLLAHRYSNPLVQIRMDGWQELRSLEALADRLLGVHGS
ncbi:MAG: hygromycin-B 7''-O-kinase [Planctomycetota bacterium]|jgi:hygromycin-B 7''-O-kinase